MKLVRELVRTPWDIVRAAHAELVVTDLDASERFYAGLLGLVVSERTPDALYLRGWEERDHHCLTLRAGAAPAVGHLAFRVREEDDLERLAAHFDVGGAGAERGGVGAPGAGGAERAEAGTPGAAGAERSGVGAPGARGAERGGAGATRWVDDERGQGRALRVRDALGFPLEFFHAIDAQPARMREYHLQRGAPILRLDHFNLHVPDVERAFGAWRDLGFRCSEYISTDGEGERLTAAWLLRKPGVHDVGLTAGRGPRLHHVGLFVADPIGVIRACDQLAAAGEAAAIERGPGRHGVSNAFFVYLRDPDGHRIELYTSDYYTGDPDLEPLRWSVSDPRARCFWGARTPASWYEQSSTLLDLDGEPVPTSPASVDERSELMA